MRQINNLRVSQKLAVFGLVLIVPLLVATIVVVSGRNAQIDGYVAELSGLAPHEAADDLVGAVEAHRWAALRAATGDAAGTAALPETAAAMRTKLDALEKAVGASAIPDLKPLMEKVAADTQALLGSATVPPAENYGRHNAAVDSIIALNDGILAQSGLALDPNADTYYLIIGAAKWGHDSFDRVSRVRDTSAVRLAAGDFDRTDAIAVAEAMQHATVTMSELSNSIALARAADPSLDKELSGAVRESADAVKDFLGSVDQRLLQSPKPQMTVADVTAAGTRAVDAVGRLHGTLLPIVAKRLEGYRAAATRARNLALFGVVLSLAAAAGIAFAIAKSILVPLRTAVGACERIAQGELGQNIEATTTEEFGALLRGLGTMQKTIKAQIEDARERAASTGRIKQALDASSAAVMVTDAAGVIIYENNAASRMFREMESDVRKDLPGFSAAAVVGSNIDHFNHNPAQQRGMLTNLTGRHSGSLMLGGHSMVLDAAPIFGEGGVRLGTVVEWRDRSEEVRAESEIEALMDAAVNGALDQRLALTGKRGFFEKVSRQINALLDGNQRVFRDMQRMFSALASGKISTRIDADYSGEYAKLKEDANATVDRLVGVVQQMQMSADLVRSGALELGRGNENLSSRTEQQASSLQETASAMEEMTSTVKHNADNAA